MSRKTRIEWHIKSKGDKMENSSPFYKIYFNLYQSPKKHVKTKLIEQQLIRFVNKLKVIYSRYLWCLLFLPSRFWACRWYSQTWHHCLCSQPTRRIHLQARRSPGQTSIRFKNSINHANIQVLKTKINCKLSSKLVGMYCHWAIDIRKF